MQTCWKKGGVRVSSWGQQVGRCWASVDSSTGSTIGSPACSSRRFFIGIGNGDDADVEVVLAGIVSDLNRLLVPFLEHGQVAGAQRDIVMFRTFIAVVIEVFTKASEDVDRHGGSFQTMMKVVDAALWKVKVVFPHFGALVDGVRVIRDPAAIDDGLLTADSTIGTPQSCATARGEGEHEE